MPGMALQGLARRAGGTRGMLILTRIQGITREAVGWPETMATATMAVAGARLDAGVGLQQAGERVEGLGGLLEAPGVRCGARARVV